MWQKDGGKFHFSPGRDSVVPVPFVGKNLPFSHWTTVTPFLIINSWFKFCCRFSVLFWGYICLSLHQFQPIWTINFPDNMSWARLEEPSTLSLGSHMIIPWLSLSRVGHLLALISCPFLCSLFLYSTYWNAPSFAYLIFGLFPFVILWVSSPRIELFGQVTAATFTEAHQEQPSTWDFRYILPLCATAQVSTERPCACLILGLGV